MVSKATFETRDYGKVEVKRANGDGSWAGMAYFFKDDFEATVDDRGQFSNLWGVVFQVYWPFYRDTEVILTATAPREVGRCRAEFPSS